MNKQFARGGKKPMLGAGSRTRTAFPAAPQKPGRTGQHATKAAPKRTRPGRAPLDEAGSMGGSQQAQQSHAYRPLESI
jgi:hypothetical protein